MLAIVAKALAILCAAAFLVYSMTHKAFREKWGIANFSSSFAGLFLAVLLPLSMIGARLLAEPQGVGFDSVYLLAWTYVVPKFSIPAGGAVSLFAIFTERGRVYPIFVILWTLFFLWSSGDPR